MAENKNLHAAKSAKKDEFYTQYDDIANELKHYRGHFKDKVVFCNCDDPYESNFFKYFALNFNILGLKRLICTCYNGSPIASTELTLFDEEPEDNKTTRVAHKVIINEIKDYNGDTAVDLQDVELLMRNDRNVVTRLEGNGDFRSQECIELMKQADIVVTNPPFSLFREYVAQLVEYDKKFLIIGNKNAITYKECFGLIKEGRMWVGFTPMSKEIYFNVPQKYIDEALENNKHRSAVKIDGKYVARSQSIWFTNLEHKKRHEDIFLYKNYTPEEYPKYENFDAIEVSKVDEIPCDYDGAMGVPITFLDKYNPDQFEILGMDTSFTDDKQRGRINGQTKYARLIIKRK